MCVWLGVLVFVTIGLGAVGGNWSYDQIDQWPGICNIGENQSPINLSKEKSIPKINPAFHFINWEVPQLTTIQNNGYTVTLRLIDETNVPIIFGGGLIGDYKFDNVHFHWQSEHTIDDERYPMEIHLVFYNAEYKNMSQALNKLGGIAVFSVIVEENDSEYSSIDALAEEVPNILEALDVQHRLEDFIKISDFLPTNTKCYFRYHGSLTTPNCNEGVIWTVFSIYKDVNSQSINLIKHIENKNGQILTQNFRPTQPLNGRKVYYIF